MTCELRPPPGAAGHAAQIAALQMSVPHSAPLPNNRPVDKLNIGFKSTTGRLSWRGFRSPLVRIEKGTFGGHWLRLRRGIFGFECLLVMCT